MKNTRLLLSLGVLLATAFGVFSQIPSASFSVPNVLRCSNQEVTLTSTSTIGIGSIVQEKWIFRTGNPADTILLPGNQTTVSFKLDNGNYIVELIAFGANGLSDTADGILRIEVSPQANFTSDLPCFPQPVVLTDASDAEDGSIVAWQWQVASLTSNNNILNYNGATGTFPVQLSVESSNGCRDTLNDFITYTDTPTLSFSPLGPITLCQGNDVSIIVSGADSFVWNNGTTGQEDIVTTGGFKVVRGLNTEQCFTTDSILVTLVPAPVADAGDDVTLLKGETTTLLGSGGIDYTWTPPEGLSDPNIANPIAKPTQTTKYVLVVVDANDCTDTDTVLVSVDQSTSIPVHNMLTPNGDGFNDKWDLSTVPDIENAKIYVFNRWGWEVFKAEDGYKNDWEGTSEGELLTDGSYLYVIEFDDDSKEPLRGTLQIIRNLQK